MTMRPGSRLGPYEILAPIGAGGMGEVYRARDTRLDRTVAIKVLQQSLAGNAQLKMRFEREAKAISSLTHPHICTLHDVGTHEGIDFLVMEHLEGETLADRIARGPLPVDEALRYGVEIADALDKAHRRGIVHRDLKPGNVMLTRTGAKLLDFGLARSVDTTSGISPESATLVATPTAARPLTEEGTIVGTFQYMAPEQLEGESIDARTDIFAFGALMYEMLTGKRAFSGKSRASVIAAILAAEPQAVSSVRPLTPRALDRVISLCMKKDPDERWQSVYDVRLELESIAIGDTTTAAPPVSKRNVLAGWLAAALVALAALAYVVYDRRANHHPPASIAFEVMPPPSTLFNSLDGPATMSPDGKQFAVRITHPNQEENVIWLRSLHSTKLRPLRGTAHAYEVFWSPDGRQLGFFARGKLRRIDVASGAITTIGSVGDSRGGSWGDDTILFAPTPYAPLHRISPTGGAATPVTKLDKSRKETGHWRPSFLPDGRRFLFIALSAEPDKSAVYLGSLDSPEVKRVLDLPTPAVYADPGFLIYLNEENLYAQPFDADEGETRGDPFLIAQDVAAIRQYASAGFSVSRNGVLIHHRRAEFPAAALARFDLTTKKETPLDFGGVNLDLSRDGTRVALQRIESQHRDDDIWIYDLRRSIASRVTFDQLAELGPVWSPDDRSLAYTVHNAEGPEAYVQPIGGAARERLLATQTLGIELVDWTRDGRTLIAETSTLANQVDLIMIDVATRKMTPFLSTPFNEHSARFSPNGKWVAYVSNESGPEEVYVQPYPPDGTKWQVSTRDGTAPRWAADGKTLFFVSGMSRMLTAVPVITANGKFETGPPREYAAIGSVDYVITHDAREAVVSRRDPATPVPLVVVTNWTQRK